MSSADADSQTHALLSALDSAFRAGVVLDTLALSAELPDLGGHDRTVGICKSLEDRNYVVLERCSMTFWILTEEGAKYAVQGMPEFRLVDWMKHNPGVRSAGGALGRFLHSSRVFAWAAGRTGPATGRAFF